MKKGTMIIDFLEDGLLKIDTGDMSGPLHKQADDFIAIVERACGGEVKAKRKPGHAHRAQTHTHRREAS